MYIGVALSIYTVCAAVVLMVVTEPICISTTDITTGVAGKSLRTIGITLAVV